MDEATKNKVRATLAWALTKKATLEAELAYVEACLEQEGFPAEDLQLEKFGEPEEG